MTINIKVRDNGPYLVEGEFTMTDAQGNRFNYLNGQVSAINLADGSLVQNITWDTTGKVQNALLTDSQGNQYTFTNGKVSQVKLSDAALAALPTLNCDTLQFCTPNNLLPKEAPEEVMRATLARFRRRQKDM